jgi:Asp/Glu/hydantoin racemase
MSLLWPVAGVVNAPARRYTVSHVIAPIAPPQVFAMRNVICWPTVGFVGFASVKAVLFVATRVKVFPVEASTGIGPGP